MYNIKIVFIDGEILEFKEVEEAEIDDVTTIIREVRENLNREEVTTIHTFFNSNIKQVIEEEI